MKPMETGKVFLEMTQLTLRVGAGTLTQGAQQSQHESDADQDVAANEVSHSSEWSRRIVSRLYHATVYQR
jgi:hypothetical protein